MDPLKLAKKLISIPSYLGSGKTEKEVGNFVYNYLKKIAYLSVQKQEVERGRFNVVARTKGKPQLLLAGHLDTVQPKTGWAVNQFAGVVKGNKLYGLGALDTKGGTAAILSAVKKFKNLSGLSLLFYCDEEYDFKGMKKFISGSSKNEIGKLAVLAEPTDLKIWNAHRGLIEIYFTVQGRTGHAGKPQSGKNAIDGIYASLINLRAWLENFSDPTLGKPSLNIAYVRGGLNTGLRRGGEYLLGREGNNIADFAESVIDIRPTKNILRAEKVVNQLKKYLEINDYKMVESRIRHDFGSLYTSPKTVDNVEKIVKKIVGKIFYLDPRNKGYGDGQLIQEKHGIPVIYLGPVGQNAHAANEFVDIDSIDKLSNIYYLLIKEYCL